jgi:acetylornithine deacetylase
VSRAAELLGQLVAIDSVNPELVRGGAGEAELAGFVAAWCRDAGLEVEVSEAAPGRPNVVAVARGSGGGRTLLLNGHTDTVGLGGPRGALDPVVEDGRLYGRGSYDMKGGLAAAMLAAARARGLRGDLIVTAVADEEVASVGTEAVALALRADAAIVCEPTEERVGVAHKGFVAFEIQTRGVAAHGSRPDLGVDAIARMGHVLVGVEAFDARLRAAPTDPLLGSGSLHASLIEGGQEYSSYPARCVVRGERRTIPGETADQVERELRALLGELGGSARVTFSREPFRIAEDEPLVELLHRHADAPSVGFFGWADSALLAAAGIPTVLFGPRGAGAHAEQEWVELASVERCAGVYLAVAEELCS